MSVQPITVRPGDDEAQQYQPDQGFRTAQPIWWSRARCNDGAGTLTSLFFSEQLDDIALAKAICAKCPVAEACIEGALERREPWGVWGGHIILKGRVIPIKRKRGRPPKHRPAVEPFPEGPLGPLITAALSDLPEVQTAQSA
jgi:WhiB family redox-sensing transcriptional regulator